MTAPHEAQAGAVPLDGAALNQLTAELLGTATQRYRYKPQPRSFTVDEPRPFPGDLRADLPWRLRCYGDGHWCSCHGEERRYPTEAIAMAAGERWNVTGRASA